MGNHSKGYFAENQDPQATGNSRCIPDWGKLQKQKIALAFKGACLMLSPSAEKIQIVQCVELVTMFLPSCVSLPHGVAALQQDLKYQEVSCTKFVLQSKSRIVLVKAEICVHFLTHITLVVNLNSYCTGVSTFYYFFKYSVILKFSMVFRIPLL